MPICAWPLTERSNFGGDWRCERGREGCWGITETHLDTKKSFRCLKNAQNSRLGAQSAFRGSIFVQNLYLDTKKSFGWPKLVKNSHLDTKSLLRWSKFIQNSRLDANKEAWAPSSIPRPLKTACWAKYWFKKSTRSILAHFVAPCQIPLHNFWEFEWNLQIKMSRGSIYRISSNSVIFFAQISSIWEKFISQNAR